MEHINNTMSAATALTTLEESLAAVGITMALSPSMSAEELCAALNTAFSGVTGYTQVISSMSSADLCTAVNGNLDLAEEQNSSNVFKFLHFSDPHGFATAQDKAKQLITNDGDYKFVFCTGDITRYGSYPSGGAGSASAIKSSFSQLGNKLLMCAGNHDAYDSTFVGDFIANNTTPNQTNCTKAIYNTIKNSGVIWGDPQQGEDNVPNIASYWHKDFALKDGNKLRVISLDQYERDVVGYKKYYDTRFSKEQLTWFADRLLELNANDYFIVVQHSQPFNIGSANFPKAPFDSPRQLFITENYGSEGVEPSNWWFIPLMVKEYKEKGSLSSTNTEISNMAGGWSCDFANAKGATFLFFLCGHTHWDCIDYSHIEGYEDQLMLCITAADIRVPYGDYDDLGENPTKVEDTRPESYFGDTPKYRINEVIIDFDKETITVNRIGTHITDAGRDRNTITFPFVREINNQQ